TSTRARLDQGHGRAPGGVARNVSTIGHRPSSSASPAMAVRAPPSSGSRPPAAAFPRNARSPRSVQTSSRNYTRPAMENWIPTASESTHARTSGGAVLTANTSGAPAYGDAQPGRAVHAAPELVSVP